MSPVWALVVDHLDLVDALARRAAQRLPRWLDLDDLVQSGRIGLLQAAERFDGRPGVKFRSFAAKRILGAIYDAHRRKNYHYELHEELVLDKHDAHDEVAMTDIAEQVQRGQVREHLNRAMVELTDDEQHAVISHALHDMGFAQIGQARQRSTSWAFRQAERGHAKMRASLARVGITEVV